MLNCSLMKFKCIKDKYGSLTPIEGKNDVPFEIKRVYYITKVEGNITRGFHSHRRLHQVLICLNGSIKIRLINPYRRSHRTKGSFYWTVYWALYLREMFDFSEGSVLLV